MKKIIIVGGGIAGLSAAYHAHQSSRTPLEITVLEQAGYWGGKILTERVQDVTSAGAFVVEGGPDTFVVTKPWAVRLCKELGIAERLKGTNPNRRATYILKNERLHELPGGLTMMIPTEFGPMLRTGLLSWPEKARMGMDFILPPSPQNGDETLGAFVTRRLGRAAYENLIEPLMSGIYAGDGDRLSLQSTFPFLHDLERQHGGLVRGALALRKERQRKSPANGKSGWRSIFLTPKDGLGEMVTALVDHLERAGVDLRLNAAVQEITPTPGGYSVLLQDGERLQAGGLVLATPSFVTADLVHGFAPALAEELRPIEFVSTATVTLAYHETDLTRPLDGYGYVIPRRAGRVALACTWTSTKFPHRAPPGYALLRVFIGRAGQEGEINWDEASLLEAAREELRLTLGIDAPPLMHRVYLWEKAMPQYALGHQQRLKRIAGCLTQYPGLALAGNAYQGIGIPDCIHSGESAALDVLSVLSEREGVTS